MRVAREAACRMRERALLEGCHLIEGSGDGVKPDTGFRDSYKLVNFPWLSFSLLQG